MTRLMTKVPAAERAAIRWHIDNPEGPSAVHPSLWRPPHPAGASGAVHDAARGQADRRQLCVTCGLEAVTRASGRWLCAIHELIRLEALAATTARFAGHGRRARPARTLRSSRRTHRSTGRRPA
jgi:hypothetical protein